MDPQQLCMAIKNMGAMTNNGNCLEWQAATDALADLSSSSFCPQETNLEQMNECKHAVMQVL